MHLETAGDRERGELQSGQFFVHPHLTHTPGAHGRPFRLETLDGALLMERVLAPGTAVLMTLEANLKTKHGVPAVAEAGSSGSIVFRTITDRVAWGTLEKELAKFYAEKIKKRKAGEMET